MKRCLESTWYMSVGSIALAALACSMQLVAAPANTANWTNTNVGTSITNAADWFTDSNWDSPSAPDGGDWKAVVLASTTGSRFIKIDRPMAIGVIT